MAFDVFDRDKSGKISQNELKYILGEYNVNAKEHLWQKMIQQIDLNQDGQISYEEFHKMMMDVINNKNKRFSMQIKKLLLMDNNENSDNNDISEINRTAIFKNAKQNATVYESRPKNNLLEEKNKTDINNDDKDKNKDEGEDKDKDKDKNKDEGEDKDKDKNKDDDKDKEKEKDNDGDKDGDNKKNNIEPIILKKE